MTGTGQAHRTAVEKAIEVMRADLADKHRVADLAAAVHISRWHFSKVFASVTGAPPYRYLVRLRMAEACRLLATTDRRVLDVAVAVGYESIGSFGDQFRAFAGCAPTDFREAAKRTAVPS